ncbi:hypothetical protein LOK49_LG11G02732 [Camellia lanceoleosa]|uniref:Uncharacterized protein n=1 Tax=Camellia lanceoleosa TaxID=1840588 RepID=A0ACC0G427_9ERIC|nr:hypothetical protein LOK49_LG11G02732 [Camellia lanceoleosa]
MPSDLCIHCSARQEVKVPSVHHFEFGWPEGIEGWLTEETL